MYHWRWKLFLHLLAPEYLCAAPSCTGKFRHFWVCTRGNAYLRTYVPGIMKLAARQTSVRFAAGQTPSFHRLQPPAVWYTGYLIDLCYGHLIGPTWRTQDRHETIIRSVGLSNAASIGLTLQVYAKEILSDCYLLRNMAAQWTNLWGVWRCCATCPLLTNLKTGIERHGYER